MANALSPRQATGPFFQGHYYAGAIQNFGGAIQYPTSIQVTITVPDAVPSVSDQAFVGLSIFDSAGSYDQIGLKDYAGAWQFTYSILPNCMNPYVTSNYISTLQMGAVPNSQYTFVMYMGPTPGDVTWAVFQANSSTKVASIFTYHDTAVWFVTGQFYTCVLPFPGTYPDYTLYEEVTSLYDQLVPDWSFMFYHAFSPNGGFGYMTCVLTPLQGCQPSGVTVGVTTNGGDVWIENQDFEAEWGTGFGSGTYLSTSGNVGYSVTATGKFGFICPGCSGLMAIGPYLPPDGWTITFGGSGSVQSVTVQAPCSAEPGTYTIASRSIDVTTGLFTVDAFTINLAPFPPYGGRCVAVGTGTNPSDLTYDTTNGYIYVANSNTNNVTVIDTFQNTLVGNVAVGTLPRHIAFDPADGQVYVPNYGSGNISVIGGSTIVATLTAHNSPLWAAYNPFNLYMYVSDFSGGSSNGYVEAISTTNAVSTLHIPSNGAGVLAYDGSNNGMFVAVAPSSGASHGVCFISSSNVPRTPCTLIANSVIPAMLWNPFNGNMYVLDSNANQVDVISSSGYNVVATIPVGVNPVAISYDSFSHYVWVANKGSNSVTVIDSALNVAFNPPIGMGAGTSPAGLAWNGWLRQMFVSASGVGVVMTIDPTYLVSRAAVYQVGSSPGPILACCNGKVYDLDTASNTMTVTPNPIPVTSWGGSPTLPQWRNQGLQTPVGRSDAALAFLNVSATPEYILVGGLSATNGAMGDTWLRHAGVWTQVCAVGGCITGPPPLWGASIIPGDTWAILFGGCLTSSPCHSVSGSTWVFSYLTNTWSVLTITGPPARYDSSASGYGGANLGILFGGRNITATFNDTWEITFAGGAFAWGQPSTPGTRPTARWSACMAYDLSDPNTQLVLFGGTSSSLSVYASTYLFNGGVPGSVTSGSWSQLTTSSSPPARSGCSLSWFGQGSRPAGTGAYVLVFGGQDTSHGAVFGDTWYFTKGNWIPLSPQYSPAPRCMASMAYSWSDQSAFLFGGINPNLPSAGPYDDGWLYY